MDRPSSVDALLVLTAYLYCYLWHAVEPVSESTSPAWGDVHSHGRLVRYSDDGGCLKTGGASHLRESHVKNVNNNITWLIVHGQVCYIF